MRSENLTPPSAVSGSANSASDLSALVFAIVFPTFVTLVYFEWLKDSAPLLQQGAYSVGKFLQFAFPIVWVWLFYRVRLSRDRVEPTELLAQRRSQTGLTGIAFGLAVAASLFAIYFGLLAETELGNRLTTMVREKIAGVGINSVWKYAGLGLFYSLVHSFMEEYYWRWFVFERLQHFVSSTAANVISSLGFMSHHVILLAFFLGWDSPLTYVCSLGVAIGGAFWAWQYHRAGRLVYPWVSHMLVDAGIFGLGYFLVRAML